MAAQYDLLAGLDITSLSSVTQSQLLQMVNQAAPLPNIGGVIYDTATPDVASNPRFARYFWLDSSTTPPTIKIYKTTTSSWQAFAPTGESIVNTTLAPHVTALDHMFNSVTADGSLADYILVYDSTGKLITQISKENLLSGLKVNLRQLKSTLAEGEIVAASVNQNNFPKYTSEGIVWGNIDLATQMFENKLATSYISPFGGTEDTNIQKILVTNPSKTAASWRSANDSNSSGIFPIGTESVGINISKLKMSGTGLSNVVPYITNASGANAWAWLPIGSITGSNAVLQVKTTSRGYATGGPYPVFDAAATFISFPQTGINTLLTNSVVRRSATSRFTIEARLNVSSSIINTLYGLMSINGTYRASGVAEVLSADAVYPMIISINSDFTTIPVGGTLEANITIVNKLQSAITINGNGSNNIKLASTIFSTLTITEHT